MTCPRIDLANLAWGLAMGTTFGMALRGTLDALFLRPRRVSFNHENINKPSGPPPLKYQPRRSGEGGPGPTTPKPEIVPKGQRPGGYQPRPSGDTPIPSPSDP